ncbi:MAG: hypothetical protein ACLFVI_02310 [Archaeoglobaceae archaeon]
MDDKFAIVILTLMVTMVAILSGIIVVQEEQQEQYCCCNQSQDDPPLINEVGPGCDKINCSDVICQNDQDQPSMSESMDYDIDI